MTINELATDILNTFLDELITGGVPEVTRQAQQAYIVSDIRKKMLCGMANQKGELSNDDYALLNYLMESDPDYNNQLNENASSEDMIKEYAEHLRNYLYTYKDSAKNYDSSIDPSEYHRGPMAQDIEKVAPDCVKETGDGTKVVDGNRLALVNAGLIGDLSRRLIALEDKVNGQ